MTLKCGPLKHKEPLSDGHSATSHKASVFNNTSVMAQILQNVFICAHDDSGRINCAGDEVQKNFLISLAR
jgi:hypothetical protein